MHSFSSVNFSFVI